MRLYDESGNLYNEQGIPIDTEGNVILSNSNPQAIYHNDKSALPEGTHGNVINPDTIPTLFPIETDGKNLFIKGEMISPDQKYPDENTGGLHLFIRRIFGV